jgi:hypothetical protein
MGLLALGAVLVSAEVDLSLFEVDLSALAVDFEADAVALSSFEEVFVSAIAVSDWTCATARTAAKVQKTRSRTLSEDFMAKLLRELKRSGADGVIRRNASLALRKSNRNMRERALHKK